MPNKLRWGVVATGGIADVVTGDLRLLPDVEVLAVSSRALPKAEAFAAKHQIPRAYGDYADLLADPDVDVVYVATPHVQHHVVTRAALEAGKHVLCEKPATLTLAELQDVVDLARERGLFFMEAIWTRFNPLIVRMSELIAEGAIGEVRSVHADFGFALDYDPAHRLWNRALGGGSLFDLGIYPVSFAHLVLGEPETVHAHGRMVGGVDAEIGMLLGYAGGAHALLGSSLVSPLRSGAVVYGTRGLVELPEAVYNPSRIVVNGVEHRHEQEGAGYVPQLREVVNRVLAGETESPSMTPAESLAILRTLTRAAERVGLSYDDVTVG
ncbi:Gfo/Idh/MocA family oxidoreductase [Saccharothrix sp. S26]|uniref:Gfo/Idh/MocA family protein n=1 Tax=Saccharothrix sp. S26 TaxID=2907215 RepID=UPI001F2DD227|nr:Gfo/Idh/MocA family oxidoreductase [Saccharothrix sp. S26]MCE6994195.1 Gfo/Idh/MocA family oxidoreductase [Saccharothrix sp. S26]